MPPHALIISLKTRTILSTCGSCLGLGVNKLNENGMKYCKPYNNLRGEVTIS